MERLIGTLLCSNLLPITMIVFGYILKFKTPKRGSLYGIRTKETIKDDKTWIAANRLCGIIWLITGIITMIISVIVIIMLRNNPDTLRMTSMILIGCQLVIMMIAYAFVQMKIKSL